MKPPRDTYKHNVSKKVDSSPNLLDDPRRIKACQQEPTKCLVSCFHLPTSYEGELGVFPLIWLTSSLCMKQSWCLRDRSEADVLEIVEIEGGPVPATQ